MKRAEAVSIVSQLHSSASGPSRVIQIVQANPERRFPLVVINCTYAFPFFIEKTQNILCFFFFLLSRASLLGQAPCFHDSAKVVLFHVPSTLARQANFRAQAGVGALASATKISFRKRK